MSRKVISVNQSGYEIVLNPKDLHFSIKNDIVEIKRGPGGNFRKLFTGTFRSNNGSDVPAQVGSYLRSKVMEFEKRIANDSQYELFKSLDKDPEDFEQMNDTHIDIIVQGLRQHNGEFYTYKL